MPVLALAFFITRSNKSKFMKLNTSISSIRRPDRSLQSKVHMIGNHGANTKSALTSALNSARKNTATEPDIGRCVCPDCVTAQPPRSTPDLALGTNSVVVATPDRLAATVISQN